MSYTLWEGSRLLGEVVFEFPTSGPEIVAGLFRPAADIADLEGQVQWCLTAVPHQPVLRTSPPPAVSDRASVPLRRLSVEELRGLPESEQWMVHDSKGHKVGTHHIALRQEDVSPLAGPMPDACRAHGFDDKVWVLVAHRVLSHRDPASGVA